MDRDTENDVCSHLVYVCQVCNFKLEFFHEPLEEVQAAVADWCSHQIDLKEGVLHVLTCPACAELRQDTIFEGYRKRVLTGRDSRFH